jgi:hypothetical protein
VARENVHLAAAREARCTNAITIGANVHIGSSAAASCTLSRGSRAAVVADSQAVHGRKIAQIVRVPAAIRGIRA